MVTFHSCWISGNSRSVKKIQICVSFLLLPTTFWSFKSVKRLLTKAAWLIISLHYSTVMCSSGEEKNDQFCHLSLMFPGVLWKWSQQVIWKQVSIINICQIKSDWTTLATALYQCCQMRTHELHPSGLVGLQTASRQNQPVAPGEASFLLRLLFFLLILIHPARPARQTL